MDYSPYTYSIIIPHKNIPQLLQECIDSIPARDDVQIIVVDDNSDPSIVDFEHFPGQGRIESYFTKEGLGAGYARNVGMRHAKGQWILFMDADDRLASDASSIFDTYQDSPSDLIIFRVNTQSHDPLKAEQNDKGDARDMRIQIFRNGYSEALLFEAPEPWGKIYRRAFLEKHGIFFEEVKYSNDCLFSAQLGLANPNMEVSDLTLYTVFYRDHSLTHTNTYDNYLTRYLVSVRVNKLLKGKTQHVNPRNTMIATWHRLYAHAPLRAILLLYKMVPIFGIQGIIRILFKSNQ